MESRTMPSHHPKTHSRPNNHGGADDLRQLDNQPIFRLIWYLSQGKKTIFISVISSLILGAIFLAVSPLKHTVSIVITPNIRLMQDNKGSLSLDQSAIKSLVGRGVNEGDDKIYDRFVLLYSSYPVIKKVNKKHSIDKIIFSNNWDTSTKSWKQKEGLLTSIKYLIYQLLGAPDWQAPNFMDLTNFISREIEIVHIKKTSARRISIEHTNIEFSANLLRALFEETTSFMRDERLNQIEAQLSMIEEKLEGISVAEHKLALLESYTLLQRSQLMMAEGIPVGAIMVQPPATPTKISSPDIVATLALFLILGLLVGITITYVRITMTINAPTIDNYSDV